jgi:hypothetical protein
MEICGTSQDENSLKIELEPSVGGVNNYNFQIGDISVDDTSSDDCDVSSDSEEDLSNTVNVNVGENNRKTIFIKEKENSENIDSSFNIFYEILYNEKSEKEAEKNEKKYVVEMNI